MSINILRWRTSGATPKREQAKMGPIGEPDAHVFNCPMCARPLSEGTPRCPGCGTRLIMGVRLRRATTLMGFGFILGTFVGGVILSVVLSTLLHPATTGAADQPAEAAPVAPAVPGASLVPVASAPPVANVRVPATASVAIRQAALLDTRIATDAAILKAAVDRKAPGIDIARAIRSLASDASIGAGLVPSLRTWAAAESLARQREAFYLDVAAVARDALRTSVTDKKAYRASGTKMLKTLGSIAMLDQVSRGIASGAGIQLPAVELGFLAK